MGVQAKHHGKVALVTGASSGMGRACGIHLQKLGFTVYGGSHSMPSVVWPDMRAQGSGLITNVSSLGGLIAISFQGVYSASKFALEGFTECPRMAVAPFGVRVVLIQPRDFATGFTAQRQRTLASQGASAYRDNCQRAIAQMELDEQHGPAPQRMAELLERILAQPAPRLRYMSGPWRQRLAVPLKWLLPHRLFEKLMMSTHHIR